MIITIHDGATTDAKDAKNDTIYSCVNRKRFYLKHNDRFYDLLRDWEEPKLANLFQLKEVELKPTIIRKTRPVVAPFEGLIMAYKSTKTVGLYLYTKQWHYENKPMAVYWDFNLQGVYMTPVATLDQWFVADITLEIK